MPSDRARARSEESWASSRISAISRTASAPAIRASTTWYSSIKKSLRKIGIATEARTRARYERCPWKNGASVRTLRQSAPWAW